MATRLLTGIIHRTDDTPWINADIRITRKPTTHAADIVYPVDAIKLTTDATGNLTYTAPDGTVTTGVELWVTDEGVDFSYYTLHLPDNTSTSFTLPLDDGSPIDLNTVVSTYGYKYYSDNLIIQNYGMRVYQAGGDVNTSMVSKLENFLSSINHIVPKLEVAFISGTDTNVGADIPFIEMADYPMIKEPDVYITVDGNGHNLYQTTNEVTASYYSDKTETKPLSFISFDYNIGAFNKTGLYMGDHDPNTTKYGVQMTWANQCHVDCDMSTRFWRNVPAGNRFICINSGSNGGTKNDLYFNDILDFTGDKVVAADTKPYKLRIQGGTETYRSHFPHTAKAFIWADLLTDTETVDLYKALIKHF